MEPRLLLSEIHFLFCPGVFSACS
ncbi:MAG: hypothetical protein ACOCXD_01975 [Bacteroidota bacterium]